MPLASAYTEADLATWVVLELGNVAAILGWDDQHAQVGKIVADTEILLGVSDVAEATDPRQVERLAGVAAWRQAVDNLAALYDLSEDAQSYSRSQVWKQAQASLERAEDIAEGDLAESPGATANANAYRVVVTTRSYLGDPFTALPANARVPGGGMGGEPT